MSPFEGKSILLAMPGDIGIFAEIRSNLERLGFRVRLITLHPGVFRYPNVRMRLVNFLRKLTGDFAYKRSLVEEFRGAEVDRLLVLTSPADYALVIRPDLFTHGQLATIRRLSGRCYAFQWDGIGRFPGVTERRGYFHRFYAFDPQDAQPGSGIMHEHNFWLDQLADDVPSRFAPVDVYYIGTYDRRAPFLLDLADRIDRADFSLRMILAGRVPGPRPQVKGVCYPGDPLSYAENLEHVRSARILIDVPHLDVHQGFSLRVLEALGAGKKLITTNPRVAEADFYHHDNIHILTKDDDALRRFLFAPAAPVHSAIRLRHGFSAWIRRVLEEPER